MAALLIGLATLGLATWAALGGRWSVNVPIGATLTIFFGVYWFLSSRRT